MRWEKVKLGDLANCIQPGPFGSQLHSSDYADEGTPIIMPKDMIGGKISHQDLIRVPDEHLQRLKRHQVFDGDLMVARKGDVRKCVYITENENGWLTGSDCLKVSLDKGKCYPKYIYYQLRSPFIGRWLETISIGATMPSLNTGLLSGIEISLPTIDEQMRIAEVLSSYDDLIENNQKQIKLLEEAAQRLYKEWFVDLRFPGHETIPTTDGIPEGWLYRPLSEVFDFVRGKSYTSKELSDAVGVLMVNLKNIRAFGGYKRNAEKRFTGQFKENQTLAAGDIVMGVTDMTQERRLVGHVALVPDMGEAMTFSMDLIKIIPKLTDKLFVYSALYYGGLSKRISPLANGVNVLHLKPEAMMGIEMLIPHDAIVRAYHEQIAPVIVRIETLQKQCDIATEARDRLLSKLMNGEIEV